MTGVDPPRAAVREAVQRALAEDLLPLGDLSAAAVPATIGRGVFVARTGGVIAGPARATETFAQPPPAAPLARVRPRLAPVMQTQDLSRFIL